MAKLQSGTVVYGNLTVNTFANINGNLILGAQLYAGGSYGTNGQVLQNIGGTGVAWANPSSGSSIFNGTSNVTVLTSGSNVVISVGGSIIANVGASGMTIVGGLSAGTITGNGAALTGLPAGYSNVNASTYFASGTAAGYINTSGNISTAQLTAGQINTTGNVLSAGGVFNALTVNGLTTTSNLQVNGFTILNAGYPTVFAPINLDPNSATGNIATYWATGRTIMGWNRSGGQGEFDIIAHRDGGSPGGFSVYDWSSANVTLANILMNINYSAGMTVSGNVTPNTSNTYTLGTSTNWWTKTWSQSVNALYADLAENYSSDKKYVPGTVVVFGGDKEVTISTESHDPAIAGIVSTDPAYLMNSELDGVAVALQGRVPCRVQGPVKKGDRLVSSDMPGVATVMDKTLYEPGCIIGKALEDITDNRVHTIEVVVGRV